MLKDSVVDAVAVAGAACYSWMSLDIIPCEHSCRSCLAAEAGL